jgi:hypothetical protein
MHGATSLLDFILNLLKDPQAQVEFRVSPEQVLATNCLTGVCAADIHETLPLVTDHRSVELAGPGHAAPPPVALVGDTGIHGAIRYLHYITGTYRYDDHGTHGHESGHENIWAVGDVGHDFDGPHPDPSGPGVSGPDQSGHWMDERHGDPHGQGAGIYGDHSGQIYGDHTNQIYGDHSGQIYGDHSGQIYGDHTGRIYGDHTSGDDHGPSDGSADGPATGATVSDTPRQSGHGDGHLHSFGSGAATTVTSTTSGPSGHSGDTSGWHTTLGSGTPADADHLTGPTSPDGSGHSPDASSFGDSYDDHGSDPYHFDDHGWDLHL